MNKDFRHIKALLSEYDAPAANFSNIQKVIITGKKVLSQREYQHVSLLSRLANQFRYISSKVWIVQFSMLIFCILFLITVSPNADRQLLFSIVSFLIALVTLVGFPELCRSYSFRMWELEQSCKYNLRQLMTLKMTILGSVDLVIIALIVVVCRRYAEMPFWQIGLYLLVPFNVTCIVGFFTISLLRSRANAYSVLAICGGAVFILFVFSNRISIFNMELFYRWITAFVISTIVLGIFIHRFIKEVAQEEYIICN